jgi:hypothetical protein
MKPCGPHPKRAMTAPHIFPVDARFGETNLVLHAKAQRHIVQGFAGPLSIKSVMDGQVGWIVDGRRLLVDEGSFLVLNDGQQYSMDVEAPRIMETCCAFFQQGFVEQVAQDVTSPVQESLDAPTRQAPPLHFLSRLHRDVNGVILPRLRSLGERCSKEILPSSFEEDFLGSRTGWFISTKRSPHRSRACRPSSPQHERNSSAGCSWRRNIFMALQRAPFHSTTWLVKRVYPDIICIELSRQSFERRRMPT